MRRGPQLATLSWGWLIGRLGRKWPVLAARSPCSASCCEPVSGSRSYRRLSGNGVTNVLPGGDAAGAAVQFGMLATAGINPDVAAAGLTAASLLGIGGLLALPVFTLPAMFGDPTVSPGLLHTALLGLGGFVLFVVGGVTIVATDRPLALVGRIAQRLWNRLPGRHAKVTGLDRRLLVQRNAVRSTLGRDWPKAVLLVGGRLGMDYLCLLGALRATGSDPRPSLVLLAYSATAIIALVPITPGGLGIVEASLSALLVLAGVSGGQAVVATLASRSASYSASVTGWRRRLFSVPATLRANTPGRPKAPVQPMSPVDGPSDGGLAQGRVEYHQGEGAPGRNLVKLDVRDCPEGQHGPGGQLGYSLSAILQVLGTSECDMPRTPPGPMRRRNNNCGWSVSCQRWPHLTEDFSMSTTWGCPVHRSHSLSHPAVYPTDAADRSESAKAADRR